MAGQATVLMYGTALRYGTATREPLHHCQAPSEARPFSAAAGHMRGYDTRKSCPALSELRRSCPCPSSVSVSVSVVQGPLIAMYATANDIISMPFKERVEAALKRDSICMYDIVTAKETIRKAQVGP
jgi:hypothetical protein